MADGKIAQAALAPTIRLLSNFRLITIAAIVIVCFFNKDSSWVLVLSVSTIPQNVALLFKWGRPSARMVVGTYFTICDAVVASWMLIVGVKQSERVLSLLVVYVLFSALVMGMLAGERALLAWWIPLLVTIVCLKIFFGYSLLAFFVFGLSAALVIMGRRLTRQMIQVEALASDVAEARSRQAGAEERLALARDLHDTVAKSAAGLRMLSESLSQSLSGSEFDHEANQLFDAAAALSLESRAVLDELRSLPVEDLVQRLKQDVITWENRTGIPVQLSCQGTFTRLDPGTTWQAQRMVGELLSNIEKHSKANHVWFHIDCASRLLLIVEDDGVGLPKAILDDPTNLRGSGHYGLCGLKERLELLEGSITLMKRPQGGTTAQVVMPLSTSSSN